ncbi:MAG TPA: phosphatidylglycerophosphatase A [Xanthomonadaceae bacterium]|nr:phosphatidylglycerophosphatase A [Xanthomonadaceae bacterium]
MSRAPVTPWREFARTVLSHPAGWLASGLGTGFAPVAAGTFGTLAAVLPYLLLRELPWPAYLATLVLAFAVGVWASDIVIGRLKIEDPGVVVWDEFVGFWLTMFLAPPGWHWIVVGFVLFRIADILKPWPAAMIDDKLGGGLGAMLDDAVAGLYAFACVQVLAHGERAGVFAALLGR